MVETEKDTYYRVTETEIWLILPYDAEIHWRKKAAVRHVFI